MIFPIFRSQLICCKEIFKILGFVVIYGVVLLFKLSSIVLVHSIPVQLSIPCPFHSIQIPPPPSSVGQYSVKIHSIIPFLPFTILPSMESTRIMFLAFNMACFARCEFRSSFLHPRLRPAVSTMTTAPFCFGACNGILSNRYRFLFSVSEYISTPICSPNTLSWSSQQPVGYTSHAPTNKGVL